MNIKAIFLMVVFAVFSLESRSAQYTDVRLDSPKTLIYKKVGDVNLILKVFSPDNAGKDLNKKYPAIVFFFGGGWQNGSVTQFEPQAKYFALRGMVSILVDYRVQSRHKTTPFDAVMDAKSAMRYVRKNADMLHVDENRIVASGGSAGGHLAAAAATVEGLNDPGDDLSVSPKPNALILFNPVFDNGPNGYGHDRIGERYKEISPIDNIKKGTPSTIVFLGTKDILIPVSTAQLYRKKMRDATNRCDLFLYENQVHGFFNYKKFYKETLYQADRFLLSLGYLKGEPIIFDK